MEARLNSKMESIFRDYSQTLMTHDKLAREVNLSMKDTRNKIKQLVAEFEAINKGLKMNFPYLCTEVMLQLLLKLQQKDFVEVY